MIRILLFMIAAPIVCSAAESCPWINSGTVGGILDRAVDSKVTQDGCDFGHRGGDRLSIQVQNMTNPRTQFMKYLSSCESKPVPLKAVGNEAVICSARHAGLAIGRVRDRAFIIRVTANERGAAKEELESKAGEAARHVAGNLF